MELEYSQYHSHGLIELFDSRTLQVTVCAPSPDFFFSILRDGIEDLLRRRWPGLAFDFIIPCRVSTHCGGSLPLRTVFRYREKQRASIDCPECLESQDVSELLTAFSPAREEEMAVLQAIRDGQDELHGHLVRVESYATQVANQTRALLRAASTEVSDCPRLFTVTPLPTKIGWAKERHALQLWCEARGQEHSLSGDPYEIDQWRNWVNRVAPYAMFVGRILSLLIPVATTGISDLVSHGDAELINRHLQMVKEVAGQVSLSVEPRLEEHSDGVRLGMVDSVALRGFRELLFSIDPSRRFGGLRSVLTPEGDVLWLCRDHAYTYDPGLPSIR